MNDSIFKSEEGLIHVNVDEPGYTRRKHGKGFVYFDLNNHKINDLQLISRIKSIGIPPMWKEV